MGDHRLVKILDYLADGPVAGESLGEVRKRIKGLGDELQTLLVGQTPLIADNLGNSEVCIKNFIAPYPLEITSIYGVKSSSADTAVAEMTAAGQNPLAGASINMHGLAADTPASQTLSATAANLKMKAAEQFKCTFTCGVSGTLDGGAVIVNYKPIQPY